MIMIMFRFPFEDDHSIVQLTPLSGKPDTNYINGSYIDVSGGFTQSFKIH